MPRAAPFFFFAPVEGAGEGGVGGPKCPCLDPKGLGQNWSFVVLPADLGNSVSSNLLAHPLNYRTLESLT